MKGKRKLLFLVLFICLFAAYPVEKAEAAKVRTPYIKTVSGDKNFVTLKWSKIAGAKGYLLYYKQRGGTYASIKTKKTSYTISGLSAGTKYYFKVKAYKKSGKKFYYSSKSPIKSFETKVQPTAKVSTVKRFLETAIKPAGTTLYVWGGGWSNTSDNLGGDKAARSIGVSQTWISYFNTQDGSYNYENTRYQDTLGLDCSGYVGWCLYNTFNTVSGNNGYVMLAQQMASNFASRGWGTYISRYSTKAYKPGDIMSSACNDCGHVWICLGKCSDGSVVILHSTPNGGVQLSGTVKKNGKTNSKAYKLAQAYNAKYFSKWTEKFDTYCKGTSYLTHYGEFVWDVSGNSMLTDPEGVQQMTPDQVLNMLLGPV